MLEKYSKIGERGAGTCGWTKRGVGCALKNLCHLAVTCLEILTLRKKSVLPCLEMTRVESCSWVGLPKGSPQAGCLVPGAQCCSGRETSSDRGSSGSPSSFLFVLAVFRALGRSWGVLYVLRFETVFLGSDDYS